MKSVETNKNCFENTQRIVYFDLLNILAIIAVIAMHVNGIVHGDPKIRAWNTSLIVDCICYWAVPVFLMLSGATLINYRKKYDTKIFFKKRFLKVLIPFMFWAIFMTIWKVYTKQINYEQISNIKKFFNFFLSNKEEPTYYFMFEILGIYLTMPFLSLVAKEENRKTLWLTVLFIFIFNSLLAKVLPLIGITYNNSLTVQVGGYIIFVLLGYLLSTQDLTKKQKIALYTFAIMGLLFRYIITFILSKKTGKVIKNTWEYDQWHSILLASAVFIFVKGLKINKKIKNNKNLVKILKDVSRCSFGVYLIHMIVMYYEISILNINILSIQWRTAGIFTTYLITLVIVYVLKKIPILKKIVP